MAGEERVMKVPVEETRMIGPLIEAMENEIGQLRQVAEAAIGLKVETESLKSKNDLLIKAVDDAQFERAKEKQDREGR